MQDVRALLEAEAVRCVFIRDNPAFDGLRASLGLRRSALSATAAGDSVQASLRHVLQSWQDLISDMLRTERIHTAKCSMLANNGL